MPTARAIVRTDQRVRPGGGGWVTRVVTSDTLTPVPWPEVFAESETLSAGHTGVLGTRAFDILHVAAAVTLGAKAFYTFDARQAALAKKAGLKVRPR